MGRGGVVCVVTEWVFIILKWDSLIAPQVRGMRYEVLQGRPCGSWAVMGCEIVPAALHSLQREGSPGCLSLRSIACLGYLLFDSEAQPPPPPLATRVTNTPAQQDTHRGGSPQPRRESGTAGQTSSSTEPHG